MMSKQISRPIALVLSLFFVAASLVRGQFAGTGKGTSPQRPPAASLARNAAITAATDAVLKETSEIRKLPILRPVRSGLQTRAEIERMVIRNLDEQTTPAEMHATEVALKKLGLAPPDFQYRDFIIKLLTEQVAGYYEYEGSPILPCRLDRA